MHIVTTKCYSHRNLDSLSPRTLNNEIPSMNSGKNNIAAFNKCTTKGIQRS